MENKQEVILGLMRAMLKLMEKLTYYNKISDKNEYWALINDVYIKIDDFACTFIEEKK